MTALVGLFVWALARAAAIADRHQLEQTDLASVLDAGVRTRDRRVGPADRRAAIRPWAIGAPGRRADDLLRRELAEERRMLRDAEADEAVAEGRQSA